MPLAIFTSSVYSLSWGSLEEALDLKLKYRVIPGELGLSIGDSEFASGCWVEIGQAFHSGD